MADITILKKGILDIFGDNKDTGDPEKKTGNKAPSQFEIHNSNDIDGKGACPIIFFKRNQLMEDKKGFWSLMDFELLQMQRELYNITETNKDFVNYGFDGCLGDETSENEYLDWEWINFRRDKNLSTEKTLKSTFILRNGLDFEIKV